jgi:hypothetical protein
MSKLNGKEHPDMTSQSRKDRQRQIRQYPGDARFLELGSPGAPFRSLVNISHISNVRFEQKIGQQEATYDDGGQMTAPPQEFLEGWAIMLVIAHGTGGQNILFPSEEEAVACYNMILDMIVATGVPISRQPKLTITPEQPEPSMIEGLDGAPIGNRDEDPTGPISDEELDGFENPDIDIDAIADAVSDGVGEKSE